MLVIILIILKSEVNIKDFHDIAKLNQGVSPGQSSWSHPKHEFPASRFPLDGGQGDALDCTQMNAKNEPDRAWQNPFLHQLMLTEMHFD